MSWFCQHPDCKGGKYGFAKRATYGKPGGKPVRCKDHKDDDMENVFKLTCTHPGCKTQPSFGYKQWKPLRCKLHKEENMESVVNRRCAHPGCKTRPSFGYEQGKTLRCRLHMEEDMKNIRGKSCRSEWCDCRIKNEKYDGYCTRCFMHLFPNDSRTPQIRVKTKEGVVRDFLDQHFEGFIHDKPIVWGGCDCTMRRRIDHRKLINGTMLAIETDEFQHRSYDAEKEVARYDDLFVGVHSGQWIFIRFNPDGYTDSKGKKRKGMFDLNGQQYWHEVERRLSALKTEIEKQIRRIECYVNTQLMEIHMMFFDELL